MRKTAAFILAVCLIVAGYWYLSREQPVQVYLATVDRGAVEATVANTRAGTIKACQRSRISMPVGGQVAELLVDEGDEVAAGQTLIRLWNEDQAARVAEAKARLAEQKAAARESCDRAAHDDRELDRQRGLAAKKLISDEKLDATETQARMSAAACARGRAGITTAESSLALQSALYQKTLLKAPFAGVVAEINGEVGEYITPSPPGVATPPAVDLIGDGCLYVSAPIDEVDAAAARLDMPAKITLDAFRGRVFEGRVMRIAPYVKEFEKQARTVDIDVRFDRIPEDVQLLVGYSADIEIILDRHDDVLRVPSEVVIDGGQVLRYHADSGRLELQVISVGLSNWTYTEVTSGLELGDTVLRSLDSEGAIDGALVEPAERRPDRVRPDSP